MTYNLLCPLVQKYYFKWLKEQTYAQHYNEYNNTMN